MEHSVGESFFSSHHVSKLVDCQLGIIRVLLNVDPSCLKCLPAHLSVEGEEPEARVSGKSTISILEKVGVVSDGDVVDALSKEVSRSCGVQGGEAHAEVTFSGELIDWSSPDGRPTEGV